MTFHSGEKRIAFNLAQKGLVLVGVPLLFELVFVGMLTAMLAHAENESLRVEHSKAIITKADTLAKLIIEAGAALAGYSAQKEASYVEHYEIAVEQIPFELAELKKLSANNQLEQARMQKIGRSVESGLEMITKIKQDLDSPPATGKAATNGARPVFRDLLEITDSLEKELASFVNDQRKLEKNSPQFEQRNRAEVHIILAVGTSLNILLALLMAHLFYNGITGRLRALTDNAIRLARGEPLNPAIAGTDEVAYLDTVFHEMAEALAEAARKQRSIIEHALDVICSIDENGKFTAVSPASVQVWGYQPEELIGHRFTELIMHEDIESTLDCTQRIMLEKALLPFENRVVRKNGTIVHILWSAYWSTAEKCMFCVAHDIEDRKRTENLLKESELRTRSIIESMPVGLLIMTDQGQIELVNPQMEKIFEMNGEQLVGMHISQLFPKAEEFLPRNFKAGAYHELAGKVREFSALRQSGEVFPAELTFVVFNTGSGPRLLVNILEVSERHAMEKLKREYVTTVSHELRTPLTSIRGSLTLLSVGALGPLADKAMLAVRIAERNVLRLINLINDLLDIEKLEAGKMDIVFEEIDLACVFERSLESVRSYADQFGIKLEIQTSDHFLVCADGDRLVQVVVNLLSNACKYSPSNESVILTAEDDGDYVKVSISDKGRGIPAETLPRIFERFQQVEAADSKRKGGSGLGLAICKAIVEQHNGNIGVESELGKGSTFWFSLPRSGSAKAPQSSQTLVSLNLPPELAELNSDLPANESVGQAPRN